MTELDRISQAARESERQRARIILHKGHADRVQEMVIAVTGSAYIMPHRQLRREKSYLLLRGRLGVVFFNDAGQVSDAFTMGIHRDDPVLVRFDAGLWHSIVSASDLSIYLETAQGPFEGSDWAEWAPESETSPEARDYLDFMKRSVFGS